eukprot:765852-Hanusia_phi.AAC.15
MSRGGWGQTTGGRGDDSVGSRVHYQGEAVGYVCGGKPLWRLNEVGKAAEEEMSLSHSKDGSSQDWNSAGALLSRAREDECTGCCNACNQRCFNLLTRIYQAPLLISIVNFAQPPKNLWANSSYLKEKGLDLQAFIAKVRSPVSMQPAKGTQDPCQNDTPEVKFKHDEVYQLVQVEHNVVRSSGQERAVVDIIEKVVERSHNEKTMSHGEVICSPIIFKSSTTPEEGEKAVMITRLPQDLQKQLDSHMRLQAHPQTERRTAYMKMVPSTVQGCRDADGPASDGSSECHRSKKGPATNLSTASHSAWVIRWRVRLLYFLVKTGSLYTIILVDSIENQLEVSHFTSGRESALSVHKSSEGSSSPRSLLSAVSADYGSSSLIADQLQGLRAVLDTADDWHFNLLKGGLSQFVGKMEILAGLFSACIHDFEHIGRAPHLESLLLKPSQVSTTTSSSRLSMIGPSIPMTSRLMKIITSFQREFATCCLLVSTHWLIPASEFCGKTTSTFFIGCLRLNGINSARW